jgi:hypothetical protein
MMRRRAGSLSGRRMKMKTRRSRSKGYEIQHEEDEE